MTHLVGRYYVPLDTSTLRRYLDCHGLGNNPGHEADLGTAEERVTLAIVLYSAEVKEKIAYLKPLGVELHISLILSGGNVERGHTMQ